MGHITDDPFKAARQILSLRRKGVTDHHVLKAVETTSRAAFVAPDYAGLAEEDCVIPLPCGQVLPRIDTMAMLVQALDVSPERGEKVLLVGGGSGYTAALLGMVAGEVYVVERYKTLVEHMDAAFRALGDEPPALRHGDGLAGWPDVGPFDRILLTGGVERMPSDLLDQLTPNGLCVAPIGFSGRQEVIRLSRSGEETGHVGTVSLGQLVSGVSQAI